MKPTDIQLHTLKSDALIRWLSGRDINGVLPPASTCALRWLILADSRLISQERLQVNAGPHVVVVQQTGSADHAHDVYPYLTCDILQSQAGATALHVVLIGGDTLLRQQYWHDAQHFISYGQPPLIRLTLWMALSVLLTGHPLLAGFLKRLIRWKSSR